MPDVSRVLRHERAKLQKQYNELGKELDKLNRAISLIEGTSIVRVRTPRKKSSDGLPEIQEDKPVRKPSTNHKTTNPDTGRMGYSDAFRAKVIRKAIKLESDTLAAQEFGLSQSTVSRWRREAGINAPEGTGQKSKYDDDTKIAALQELENNGQDYEAVREGFGIPVGTLRRWWGSYTGEGVVA